MSNHTEGPWHVTQHGTMVVSDLSGDIENTHIASVVGHNGNANFGADGLMANAHLIAAAPDLLAALEEILDGYLYGCDMKTKRENINKSNAAITKARGEA